MTKIETTDASRIAAGIAKAKAEDREIDDLTAKIIASQFHDGSAVALGFLSTGAYEGCTNTWRAFGDDYHSHDAEGRLALDWLGTYLLNRSDRGPVKGWEDLSW